jgi:ATP-dependent protease ClpP protease subunit
MTRDEAVAARLEAEAEQAKANAEKARAEARKAAADAQLLEIDLEQARRKEAELAASDQFHHTLNFTSMVNESSVKAAMDKLSCWHRMEPDCDITILLNSPGGDVIDGMALFDHILWLREQGHRVTIVVRGMAASMAGILLQAASHRVVGKEAWVLIHRAAFGAMGKSFEIEDKVKWVKRVEDRILDIFVARAAEAKANGTAETPLTKAKIRNRWERADWWLTSDECIRYGVADEVR